MIKRTPQRALDWCAHRGGSAEALRQACPSATVIRVEEQPQRHAVAASGRWWSKWIGASASSAAPVVAPDALAPYGADMLWSNMGLHLVADPEAQFVQWRRLIATDGFLMFTTLGPGTLVELNALYADAGWGPALAPLVDMHDLGDMLVQAGFAEPVMDQETLTLTWRDAAAAVAELRTLGGNAHPRRFAGLRTGHWRRQLLQALDRRCDGDGRVRLSIELVYGHAFCTAPRVRLAEESRVGIDEMRAMMRSGKPSGGPGALR